MGKAKKPQLSIIIPAYNEEKRISKTLDDFSDFFGKKKITHEILVIMDGCSDKTPDIVERKSKKNRNIRFRVYKKKQGKGGALLNGFMLASGKYVAFTDADGSTSPSELYRIFTMIDEFDGVIGSRWLKGSVIVQRQPLTRRIASRGFNGLTRMVLGLPYNDTQCPAKIFKREVARYIVKNMKVTNFAIDASMLYVIKKAGFRVKEVPITWDDKPMSTLKMRNAIPGMLFTILKLRFGL